MTGGPTPNKQREKKVMKQDQLRKKLIDATGEVWRNTTSEEMDWRFETIDMQADDLMERQDVEVRYVPGASAISVFTLDGLLIDVIQLDEIQRHLGLVREYARFANGFMEHFPEAQQRPSMAHCRAMTEALIAFGEKDPAYTASDLGISFWIGNGYLVEYREDLSAYLLWKDGEYSAAATTEGLISAYSDLFIKEKQLSKRR